METKSETIFEKVNNSIRNSIMFKLSSIGILILLLLIPTSMIRSLIGEREQTQRATVSEVSEKWGGYQTVSGPVLSIPYKTYYKKDDGKVVTSTNYAHFLPKTLNINGKVHPETLKRGIYEVVLYNAKMKIDGNFELPDFTGWNIKTENVIWEDAFISIGIPDMSGIKESIALTWNGDNIDFKSGIPVHQVIQSGVSARIPLKIGEDATSDYQYSFNLDLNGSKSLNFVPVGKTTHVNITSTWKDPKFWGKFLPNSRKVDENGFEASWTTFDLNRNYPQQWLGKDQDIYTSSFGLDLLLPVDEYQKNMRSAKYASLIISLTFLIFFFVEILNKKRIHPFQYILVGLALCIFYVLLISLTEHFGFNIAYGISGSLVVLLITGYASAILKSTRLTGILFGFLSLVYAFLFVILQLQDFSLLVGSIGLFITLAVSMYLSRKIDWYNINKTKNTASPVA